MSFPRWFENKRHEYHTAIRFLGKEEVTEMLRSAYLAGCKAGRSAERKAASRKPRALESQA